MNNLNDYYNYLNNGYNDMNFVLNPNNMINDMNYNNLMPNNMVNDKDFLANTMKGFKRGNMFDNLYEEYKNYKPMELKANTEREDIMLQIDEQRFAMIDLGLYLDLNPNDKSAINRFNTSLKKEKELVDLYESKYGPLTMYYPVGNDYIWNNNPWPWEVQK